MDSGRSCTVMHLGRQGIDGSARLYLLDGVKLRYSGIFRLMQQQALIALGTLAITEDGVFSEGLRSAHTLVYLVILK